MYCVWLPSINYFCSILIVSKVRRDISAGVQSTFFRPSLQSSVVVCTRLSARYSVTVAQPLQQTESEQQCSYPTQRLLPRGQQRVAVVTHERLVAVVALRAHI